MTQSSTIADASQPEPGRDGDPAPGDSPRGRWGPDVFAAAVCVAVGLLMVLLPYVLWWRSLGEFVYVADSDEMTLYLPMGSQAYYDHPTSLADPSRAEGGLAIYPWLQMVPGILIARAMDWGPMGIGLGWRIVAGVTVPLGWYFVLRQYVKRPAVAASLAVFLMSDAGLVFGTPLLRQARIALKVLTGSAADLFERYPLIHTEWRIATPGLSFLFLLVYLGLLGRALSRPTWPRILAASLGLGLLIHAYFYFWTAAGLGLALGILIDARNRKNLFLIGVLGSLVGLPAVIAGARLKAASSPDFGPRLDTFLPIKRMSEIVVPATSIVLLLVTLAWVWWRRKELLYLWCLATAGVLLLNQQVVSGMAIQNFHWQYAGGPALFLLLVLLVHGELTRGRPWPRRAVWPLAAAAGAYLILGLWLRGVEAMRTHETREHLTAYDHFRAQQREGESPALAPRSVIAGRADFVNMAVVLERLLPLSHNVLTHSAVTGDDEWDARIALDAYLNGVARSTFAAEQDAAMQRGWGPWSRDPDARARRLAGLLADYDADAADPRPALDRFRVRYFAGSPGQVPPGSGWTRLARGRYWDLWQRPTPVTPPGD